jgi:hypothetical protein
MAGATLSVLISVVTDVMTGVFSGAVVGVAAMNSWRAGPPGHALLG